MREWIANYCNFPRFMMQMLNFRAGFFGASGCGGPFVKSFWWHGLVNKNTHSDKQVFSAVPYTVTVQHQRRCWCGRKAFAGRSFLFWRGASLIGENTYEEAGTWGMQHVYQTRPANHAVLPPPPHKSLSQEPEAYDLICRSIPILEWAVGELCLVALLSLWLLRRHRRIELVRYERACGMR